MACGSTPDLLVEARRRVMSVANMGPHEIGAVVEGLRSSSGAKARPFHQAVASDAPAVRPLWSPFHDRPAAPPLP